MHYMKLYGHVWCRMEGDTLRYFSGDATEYNAIRLAFTFSIDT